MNPKTHVHKTASRSKPNRMDSPLSDQDVYLFNEGRHFHLHQKLGSHLGVQKEKQGTHFAVWAPDAAEVHVMGDFNQWCKKTHPLTPRGNSGIWESFVPGAKKGEAYKYHLRSHHHGYQVDKADPFAFRHQIAPDTASIIWDLEYEWNDSDWVERRKESNLAQEPVSIYEVHVGSWRRVPGEGNRSLSYREMAKELVQYVKYMGFTHVELMPVMEHPFYGSWGYQITGFFAPSGMYGTPQDLMHLIDSLHQEGIGVIFDWVPSHFVRDEHGPGFFDGSHLYEHADPRLGIHPDWDSYIFNYGRKEIQSFLISSALYWLDAYHADGLRVDAVASMLYLDYSRKDGEWIPNQHGGNENLEAISFLRTLNEEVYKATPGVTTIAEESTAWPMVSRPTYIGGLGFGMKWDMGWMHDTLNYFELDPIFRKFHHDKLTFRMLYSFTENFVLPISHDEVVHGKKSLLSKMPGGLWEKFANLRVFYSYMYAQPGKKLLFMGSEFGQWAEWNHDTSLDWHLLQHSSHQGVQLWFNHLNHFYRSEPAMHTQDFHPDGFEWADCHNADDSIISLFRKGKNGEMILGVFNFTPVPRSHHQLGVPHPGYWKEVLNSNAQCYGGTGQGNLGGVQAVEEQYHDRPCRLDLVIPPLSAIFFRGPDNGKAGS